MNASSIHVLHVIDKLSMDGKNPSSCTVLFGGWAPYLRSVGCDIEVLSLSNDREIAPYLIEREIPTSFVQSSKLSLANIAEIARTIKDRHFDLIHLHGYGAAHFGRLASRRCGVPNVVHEHAVLKVKPQHYMVDRLLRNKTDVAVAVSNYVKQFMIKGRCIPSNRIRIIGNGVDLSRFRAADEQQLAKVRQSLGIEQRTPLIGTVTRFRTEKGNEYLIKAFALISHRYRHAQLVIVGDGPDREALKTLARKLDVHKSIHWLGFRSDVEKIMPIFDIHVIPSLSEGYPLALAEGMAVGNAMVVTEVGGMREIGTDRQNVLFVREKDAEGIANSCLELLEDTSLAKDIARNGAATAQGMSIDASAAKLRALYGELMSMK